MLHDSFPLPTLTANRRLFQTFISEPAPCFTLGLLEEQGEPLAFLGLRPEEPIPEQFTESGFAFGHSLIGNQDFEVLHFGFEFYGYQHYNVLLNPNNRIVQTVLQSMLARKDYFFFTIDAATHGATAFRAGLGPNPLELLRLSLPRIMDSITSDAQYQQALSEFDLNPSPPGKRLNWVCRDHTGALDLTNDRMSLTPV